MDFSYRDTNFSFKDGVKEIFETYLICYAKNRKIVGFQSY